MNMDKIASALRKIADAISAEQAQPRGDAEVAAPRNCSEIPNGSTPRRSWKRWARIGDEHGNLGPHMEMSKNGRFNQPVTVIEGHIDLAEIEREAYRLGEKYGHDNGYAEAMRDMRGSTTPQPIDGVEPVVVEAWTFADNPHQDPPQPWTQTRGGELYVAAFKMRGGQCNTPCTVAIWTGVKNGKKVLT